MACSAAKDEGRNRVQTYLQGEDHLLRKKAEMKWFHRIHNALKDDRFVLYCQQIEPLKHSDEDFHFEILFRMIDEHGEILAPGMFMPAAERFHLMPLLDRWVIRNTLSLLSRELLAIGTINGTISINLSGQSLGDPRFHQFVSDELNQSLFPADWLCFEITESAAIGNFKLAKNFIISMRKKGYRFSLDDFGTGMSSFAYLKTLDVDYLKIDGSFVKEILSDPLSRSIVIAVKQIADTMGVRTIAEYVENDAIKDSLYRLGIDYGQGYGIGCPLPLTDRLHTIKSTFAPRYDSTQNQH